MSNPHTLDSILRDVHERNGADQTALYYFSYPETTSLILCRRIGNEHIAERYWRAYCGDAHLLNSVRQTAAPFLLPGEAITGEREQLAALPIMHGDVVFGVVVHCLLNENRPDLETMRQRIQDHASELFDGWVEFLVAERSRPLSVLFHIAGCISSSLDLDRVLLSVVEQATILFHAKMSSLMLVDAVRRELEMITAYGCSLEYLNKPNLPIEGSILGRVVVDNRALSIENIMDEPLYMHRDLAAREGVNSLMASPICFQNEVLGVLNIYSSSPRRWQQSEMELLRTFADHAAIAITNVRVHEQIMAMEEQMQVSSKLATLGELAAGLAHEIRNPLAVINMLIHSWKVSPPTIQDFDHDVDVIAQKISDLNSLVTDLLNLAAKRPLERKRCNMEELINRVLRLLRHRINQQRVIVKKQIACENTEIEVDRERIEQAVLNLLLNALDATPEEGVIAVTLREEDGFLVMDVADSGAGISPERIPALFKPFNTTKKTGIGLGLPMTKRIVEEHKGQLEVSSNFPEGAVFTIALPRLAESTQDFASRG